MLQIDRSDYVVKMVLCIIWIPNNKIRHHLETEINVAKTKHFFEGGMNSETTEEKLQLLFR